MSEASEKAAEVVPDAVDSVNSEGSESESEFVVKEVDIDLQDHEDHDHEEHLSGEEQKLIDEYKAELNDYAVILKKFTEPHKPYSIPPLLLAACEGIAIRKDRKASLIIGASWAKCAVFAKHCPKKIKESLFTPPVAYKWSGVHIGIDIGGESAHIVSLIFNKSVVERLIQGSFGTGRASTGIAIVKGLEVNVGAKDVLAFTTTKGAYVGVSFEGGRVFARNRLNRTFYGDQDVKLEDLMANKGNPPSWWAESEMAKALSGLPTVYEIGKEIIARDKQKEINALADRAAKESKKKKGGWFHREKKEADSEEVKPLTEAAE